MSEISSQVDVHGRSEEDVRNAVRAIVVDLAPGADEAHSTSVLIDDLGYHSLALLELGFTLEDEFDLPPIDQQTAQQVTTVAAVEDHVVTALRHRGELS
ncbi:acyl carrier protein [Nocardia sp. NPDC051321]|uniref:acyl carrier protein n=1 Tax=Nocardia sp. NPDC051321 TaxID=3364323 RepID=UPI0037B7DE02